MSLIAKTLSAFLLPTNTVPDGLMDIDLAFSILLAYILILKPSGKLILFKSSSISILLKKLIVELIRVKNIIESIFILLNFVP